jgi:hypothetical protein
MNHSFLIAQIVARVREHNGEHVDETHLAHAIEDALHKLQVEDEKKYLEVIQELSEHLEILSKEVGRLRTILQNQDAQSHTPHQH